MAVSDLKFSLLWAVLGGILGFVLATLLEDTAIFGAIPNLAEIGLFVGFLAGGFKDKLGIF